MLGMATLTMELSITVTKIPASITPRAIRLPYPVTLAGPTSDGAGTPRLMVGTDSYLATQATSTSCQSPNRRPTCCGEGRGASWDHAARAWRTPSITTSHPVGICSLPYVARTRDRGDE